MAQWLKWSRGVISFLYEGKPAVQVIARDNTERKTTAEKLIAQEKQYRVLFETYPSPTWVYDAETLAFLAVNDAAVRHYGYSREEFLAMTIRDIRPPEDIAALLASGTVTVDKPQAAGVWRHRKKSGEIILVDIYASAIRFEGRLAQLAAVLDITERKTTEKQLRETEEKYRSIFDNALEGIFQNTPDGIILSANPALARMFGFSSPEEFLREHNSLEPQSYTHPAEREEFKRLIEEKGVVNNFEYEVKRKDGTTIWVSENARIVRDDAGDTLYYEGSVQDITERKRSELVLRENEEHLRLVIAASNDGIWEHDYLTDVLTWSDRMYEMFGLDQRSFVPTVGSFTALLHPDDRALFQKTVREQMANGGRYEAHMRILRRDGSYGNFLGRGRVVLDTAGKPIRIVGSLR